MSEVIYPKETRLIQSHNQEKNCTISSEQFHSAYLKDVVSDSRVAQQKSAPAVIWRS